MKEAGVADLGAGEDEFEVGGAEGVVDDFAEDLAVVGGEGEIAAFVELVACRGRASGRTPCRL